MKGQWKRLIKKSTRQYIIVAMICILVIGSAAVFTTIVMTMQVKEKYVGLLTMAHNEMEENKRSIFIATTEIKAGECITSDNIIRETVYASQPIDTYIQEEDIGKIALVTLVEGTHILGSMLTENNISSELRESEYGVININSNIISNDTVDVRIAFPNGENYVVLSKKVIKGIYPETTTCFFWMDEEELLRMSAAIVDAGLYTGSHIYVTKYIEPSIQDASIVTYTPSLAILSLIENDPNIVERYSQELSREVRKAFENRMAASMTTDVSVIQWDVNTNNQFIGATPTPAPTDPEEIEVGKEKKDFYLFYSEEDTLKKGDTEYGE